MVFKLCSMNKLTSLKHKAPFKVLYVAALIERATKEPSSDSKQFAECEELTLTPWCQLASVTNQSTTGNVLLVPMSNCGYTKPSSHIPKVTSTVFSSGGVQKGALRHRFSSGASGGPRRAEQSPPTQGCFALATELLADVSR